MGVTYTCYNLKYRLSFPKKKCPDDSSDKCMTCKYCKAEMSAYDATRLMNSYGKHFGK